MVSEMSTWLKFERHAGHVLATCPISLASKRGGHTSTHTARQWSWNMCRQFCKCATSRLLWPSVSDSAERPSGTSEAGGSAASEGRAARQMMHSASMAGSGRGSAEAGGPARTTARRGWPARTRLGLVRPVNDAGFYSEKWLHHVGATVFPATFSKTLF